MSKVSKWRACPAVGRDIRSAECGENRNSEYACAGDCAFNPFTAANYDQLLEIEKKVDDVIMDLFAEEWQTRPWLMSKFKNAVERNEQLEGNALVNTTVWVERDSSGKTPGERFLEKGLPGLKNDHRVMFRAKKDLRVALFEAHEVVDDLLVRGVDLWRPEEGEILVADRSLAARTPRFVVVYATVYRLPLFHRFHGAVFPIAQYHGFDAGAVMEAVIEHLKGPGRNEDRRGWLIANAGRVIEALTHTALARNQKMLELSDAVIGIANYNALGEIDECVSKLNERDDVLRDEPGDEDFNAGFDEAWDWFKNPTTESGGGGDLMIGRVLLGDGIWRLKATGANKLAELRERFEKLMGPEVAFESQRLDDIRPQSLKYKPELAVTKLVDSASPVSLESSRTVQFKPGETAEDLKARMLADYDRRFLEQSIPALDGMTPRQAAASPAHRGKLIALMKERIRGLDEQNLRSGRNDSIEWMVEELGLKEIAFPAPPARAIPPEYAAENEEEEIDEDDDLDDLPPAPRLPDGPLSGDEIAQRLVKIGMTLDTPEEHIEALRRAGGTATVDLEEALGDFLTEDEFSAGLMLVTKASFVMVPPGHRFPPVDMDRVFNDVKEYLEILRRAKSPKAMLDPGARSRQPTLVACLSVMLIDSPGGLIRPESAFAISAFLMAYTNELDRQLRG